MVNCPFGAISDKSQIFQLAHALKEGKQIVAEVAPAFVSQFGPDVTSGQLRDALLDLPMYLRWLWEPISERLLRHAIMRRR